MGKIHKLTKEKQTIYPATITDAVVHPDLKVSTSKLIEEINVSKLFPTGGIDGSNKYTLETAIAKIPASLQNVGLKCSFLGEGGELETWVWHGGAFLHAGSWTRSDITAVNEKIDSQKKEVDAARDEALEAINSEEQDTIANFNSQRVTPEMLSESTMQLINSSGGGSVTNMADDEDIESKENDLGIKVLKFADRKYNASNFSGKGYKILRKNIAEGKNILFQEMINESNTIYEIRYDFDLNGQTITVPENCILQFEGGSFRNGTVVGNNTVIVSNSQCFQDILLTNFNNNIIHDYWFYDDIEDILESVQQGILQLSPVQYTINKDVYVKAEVKIIGDNTKFISNKSIYLGWRNSIRNIYFKSDNNNDSPVIKLDSNHIQDSIDELSNKPDTHYTYLNLTIDNCEFDRAKLAINAVLSNTRTGWGFNIINNRFIYTTLGIKFEINPDDENTDAWFTNIDIRGNKFTEGGNGILFDKGNSPKYTRYGGIFIEGNAIQYQENTEYFLKAYCVNNAVIRDNKVWDTSHSYFIHKYSCKYIVIYDFFSNTAESNLTVFEDTGDNYSGRNIVQCNYYNGYLQKVRNIFPQPLNGEFYSFRDLQYIPDGNYSVNTDTVKKIINDENLSHYNDLWYIDIKTYDNAYRRINISYSLLNSAYVQNPSYNYVEYVTEFYVNTDYPDEHIPLGAFRFICSPYCARATNDIPYKPKGLPIWEIAYGKLGCISDRGEFVGYNGKTIGRDYGITSERPTLVSRDAGYMYYDTSINKPIWWTGTKWVDANGTDV